MSLIIALSGFALDCICSYVQQLSKNEIILSQSVLGHFVSDVVALLYLQVVQGQLQTKDGVVCCDVVRRCWLKLSYVDILAEVTNWFKYNVCFRLSKLGNTPWCHQVILQICTKSWNLYNMEIWRISHVSSSLSPHKFIKFCHHSSLQCSTRSVWYWLK